MNNILVKTKIRELIKHGERPLKMSKDFYSELEKEIELIIKKSCKRAVSNARSTVMAKDI